MSVNFSDRETLDIRSAARVLGISEPSLRRAVAAGHLPTVTIPGVRRVLFSRQRIEAIIRGDGAVATDARHAERPQLSAA